MQDAEPAVAPDPKPLPEQHGKKVSAYHSPHMNLVQLSITKKTRRVKMA